MTRKAKKLNIFHRVHKQVPKLGSAPRFLWHLFISISLCLPPVPLMPQKAFGQSYQAGYSYYMKGKTAKAESALLKALKLTKRASEKAKIYKLLGIVQYMRNKKGAATTSFRRALAFNPRTSISSSEVLDTSVIAYFNQVKSMRRPTKARRPAPKTTTARFGKPTNNTTILIQSNVRARVYIDGIITGNTGTVIEASPGRTVLTLKANGYKTKKLGINVRKNRQNGFRVTMDKIKPKVKPRPKRVVRRKRSSQGGMFQEKEPQFSDNNRRRTRNQRRPSLVDEFNSDGSYPSAPAPGAAPMAPAPSPYGYPAPMPAYPPMMPYPPMYPPMMPYAPAPYMPPPSPYGGSPYGGGGIASPPPPEYHAPSQSPSYRKKSRRRRAASSGGPDNLFIALLPFGAGQYQNGDMLFGAFFTAAELGSLIIWNQSTTAADSAASDQKTINDSDDYPKDKAGTERKQEDINILQKFINEQRTQADIAIILFGALWAGGALEAILNAPVPKRKKKRRRYGLLEAQEYKLAKGDNLDYRMIGDQISPSRPAPLKMEFRPVFFQEEESLEIGLGLNIDF